MGIAHLSGTLVNLLPDIPLGQSYPYANYDMAFFSRHPQELPAWTSLTGIFHWKVWIGLLASLIGFSISFILIFSVYKRLSLTKPLLNENITKPYIWIDFVTRTFFGFTEPEKHVWFSAELSAGLNYCSYFITTIHYICHLTLP